MFPVRLINPPVRYQVNQESSTENIHYSGTNELKAGRHLKEVIANISEYIETHAQTFRDVGWLQSLVVTGINVFLILNQLTREFNHFLFELAVLLRLQAPAVQPTHKDQCSLVLDPDMVRKMETVEGGRLFFDGCWEVKWSVKFSFYWLRGSRSENSLKTLQEHCRVVVRGKGCAVFEKWIYVTLCCATGELHLFNWHIFTDYQSAEACSYWFHRELPEHDGDDSSVYEETVVHPFCEDFCRHFGKYMKWLTVKTVRAEQLHQDTKD